MVAAKDPRTTVRRPHLDMLRGLAAIAVMAGHVRGMVLLDAAQQPGLSLPAQAFYFLTSLGHQAVIVFFALSGFLVGGTAFRQIVERRWDVRGYWTRRLSRLLTVLVPALLLTALCDFIGRQYAGGGFYNGDMFALVSAGPSPDAPADNSMAAFIGNLFFLQTIAVPVYGSNGPLWSLANAFWYYLLFPPLLLLYSDTLSAGRKLLLGLGIAAAFILLPFGIVALGAIWVAGAATALATRWVESWGRGQLALAWICLLPLLLLGLAWSRFGGGLAGDLALGLAMCMALPMLCALPNRWPVYERTAFALSEVSYSLYASHFPVAALGWLLLLGAGQYAFGLSGVAIWAIMCSGLMAMAGLFWWSTERHTLRLRWAMERLWQREKAA